MLIILNLDYYTNLQKRKSPTKPQKLIQKTWCLKLKFGTKQKSRTLQRLQWKLTFEIHVAWISVLSVYPLLCNLIFFNHRSRRKTNKIPKQSLAITIRAMKDAVTVLKACDRLSCFLYWLSAFQSLKDRIFQSTWLIRHPNVKQLY